MKATIVDLRYRTKAVLSAVERGETVTILYRGKPKARLSPIAEEPKGAKLTADKAFGLWKDHDGLRDVSAYVRRLRKRRTHDV